MIKDPMKPILFIGHDASRTGAPFVLLHLLRWLKRYVPERHFELLLLNGGELESEFRSVCNVHILYTQVSGTRINYFAKTARSLRKRAGLEERLLSRLAARFDVVLGNTAVSLEHLSFFKSRGCSTFCWMHEMDYALDLFYSRERFRELAEETDALIVGSQAVREMLLRRGITRPVHVVYEFLDLDASGKTDINDLKAENGIPADAFVVGACATIEWRKGVDLFVQIARLLATRDPNVYCMWLGGRSIAAQATMDQVLYDVRKLGLDGRVLFVDPQHELSRYYRAMDLFLLPSREDPFPLVCIEAALCKKPVICFRDAGGMPEFVEDDCGFVVPYLDVEAAADRIHQLSADPQLRKKMGEAAAAKVRDRHDVSHGAVKILKIIDNSGT